MDILTEILMLFVSSIALFLFLFQPQIARWIDAKADELRARAEKIRKEKNNGIHENI